MEALDKTGLEAAPERIWLSAADSDNECQVWAEADEGGTEYVRADLASAGYPAVKALKWRDLSYKALDMVASHPFGGEYHITEEGEHQWPFVVRPFLTPQSNYQTLGEAKTACEADYERRVRSALHLTPTPVSAPVGVGCLTDIERRLCHVQADLSTAGDLLHERWKSQSKEVSRRLIEHVETVAEARKLLSSLSYRVAPVSQKEAVPVAWRSRGPKGGWIYRDEKPKGWPSEPLYASPVPAPAVEPVGIKALRELETKAIGQKDHFNAKQHEFPSLEDFTDDEGNLSLPPDIAALLRQAEANGRYSEADWWLSTIRSALHASPTPVSAPVESEIIDELIKPEDGLTFEYVLARYRGIRRKAQALRSQAVEGK